MTPHIYRPPLDLNDKPFCLFCKNYQGLLKCKAYPSGIPDDILEDEVFHDRVFDDQEGEILFEFDEDSSHVKLSELCIHRGILIQSSGDNTST